MYISDQLVIEEKVEIEHNKVASDAEKVEIKDKNDLLGARKVEIGAKTFLLPKSVTQKTIDHARMLYFNLTIQMCSPERKWKSSPV